MITHAMSVRKLTELFALDQLNYLVVAPAREILNLVLFGSDAAVVWGKYGFLYVLIITKSHVFCFVVFKFYTLETRNCQL